MPDRKPKREDPSRETPARPPPETSWVTVGRDEILAARIVIRAQDHKHDEILSRLYSEHSSLFDDAIRAAVREKIGDGPALFLSVDAGSISICYGITPPRRYRYGLDRITHAVVKNIHEVTSDKLDRLAPLLLFMEPMHHKIVAVRRNMWRSAATDALCEVWVNVRAEAMAALIEWLEELREKQAWNWN